MEEINTEQDKEKEIISKLFIKEKDNLKTTEKIIANLMKFIKIEKESENILFINNNLGIETKIFLTLTGKHFLDKFKKSGEGEMNLISIAKIINTPTTSLPLFIQRLLDAGLIIKPSRGIYRINPYKIEEGLGKLEKN